MEASSPLSIYEVRDNDIIFVENAKILNNNVKFIRGENQENTEQEFNLEEYLNNEINKLIDVLRIIYFN